MVSPIGTLPSLPGQGRVRRVDVLLGAVQGGRPRLLPEGHLGREGRQLSRLLLRAAQEQGRLDRQAGGRGERISAHGYLLTVSCVLRCEGFRLRQFFEVANE